MRPIEFPEANCVYAKDQPEYLPLPVYKTDYGSVTACYELTFKEKIRILFGAKVWFTLLTFNNRLQPQRAEVSRKLPDSHVYE